jgi:hypothetical protein
VKLDNSMARTTRIVYLVSGLFFALLSISVLQLPDANGWETTVSLLVLLGVPACCFLGMGIFSRGDW